jgi:hypothetical protein
MGQDGEAALPGAGAEAPAAAGAGGASWQQAQEAALAKPEAKDPNRGAAASVHDFGAKAAKEEAVSKGGIYDEMVKAKLDGWEYEIISYADEGEARRYRVRVISSKYGVGFNQEIELLCDGGSVTALYVTEFMGL